jgi:Tol biopolymer transport system component
MRWRVQMTCAITVAAILVGMSASAHAAFPGKNGKIAFSTGRDDTSNCDGLGCPDPNFEIYTMNPDGTGVTRLTSSRDIDHSPAWSADGSKIVFLSRRANLHADGDIFTMNADGTGQTNLTNTPGPEAVAEYYPSWSPDGSKIVFMMFQEIYVMNADGTAQTNLTNNPANDNQPVWSPDGTRIAFISDRNGDYLEIYTMNADGTSVTRLTNHPGIDIDPDWSPDGTKIAFTSFPSTGNGDIFTMNADGTGRMNRSNHPAYELFPVWSPDGTKIAFDRSIDGPDGLINVEIYAMNADGTGQTNLTNNPAGDARPDWQPIPRPQRSDYKSAARFCKAEQAFWGDQFAQRYGGGGNAYGKCVSGK